MTLAPTGDLRCQTGRPTPDQDGKTGGDQPAVSPQCSLSRTDTSTHILGLLPQGNPFLTPTSRTHNIYSLMHTHDMHACTLLPITQNIVQVFCTYCTYLLLPCIMLQLGTIKWLSEYAWRHIYRSFVNSKAPRKFQSISQFYENFSSWNMRHTGRYNDEKMR